MNNDVFKKFTYGLFIISAKSDKKVGCVSNSVIQVSSGEKKIISVSLNKNNYTLEVIKNNHKFAINILGENVDPNVIKTFGFTSSRDTDKFSNFKHTEKDNLPILTDNIVGYLICNVIDMIDCDTHYLVLAEVIDANLLINDTPLTYKYYQENMKTSLGNMKVGEIIYRCPICGYEHVGPLPDGFKCPMCGVDGTLFTKVE